MKTLNFTGKKEIAKDDVEVFLREDSNGKPVADIRVKLGRYKFQFSPDVHVYIVARRQHRNQRIFLGKLMQDEFNKDSVPLDEFDDAEGINFKVIVVDVNSGLKRGQAENIRLFDKNEQPNESDECILSLWPVPDLSGYYRVIFQEKGPVLQYNADLGTKSQIIQNPIFKSMILPAVLKEILQRIMYVEKRWNLLDEDEFSTKWLKLAKQYGVDFPEQSPEESDDDYEWKDDLIQRTVDNFSQKHNSKNEIIKIIRGY